MHMKSKVHIISILVAMLLPMTSFAQLYPLSENDWQNPEFIERYLGSYGIDMELSPEISPAEAAVMSGLAPFIEDDVESGIFFLEPQITPESSAALDYMLAQLYLENEQADMAIEAYSRAIRKFPNFLRAYKNISLAYMQSNNCEGAMPHLNKVMELGRADGLIYGFLGYCYLEDEKFSSSMSAYANARLFEPDKENWKVGYVQAAMQARKYQDAIVALNELVIDEPEDATYLMLQTNAYIALGDDEDAISNLEVINRLGKANGMSHTLLGDLYMRNDVPALALRSYLAALGANQRPNFARASRAVDFFASEERWQNATAYMNRLKAVFGDNLTDSEQVELSIMEAQIAQGNGDFASAATLLNDAVTKAPLHGKALLLLAQNNKNAGDYERAEIYYDRAAEVEDVAYDALTDNARMAVSFRRFERALSLLNRASQIRPSAMLDNNIRIVENAINSGG